MKNPADPADNARRTITLSPEGKSFSAENYSLVPVDPDGSQKVISGHQLIVLSIAFHAFNAKHNDYDPVSGEVTNSSIEIQDYLPLKIKDSENLLYVSRIRIQGVNYSAGKYLFVSVLYDKKENNLRLFGVSARTDEMTPDPSFFANEEGWT